jgi:hypothetical protein
MKTNKVSLYNLEIIVDSYNPPAVRNKLQSYSLEIISDIYKAPAEKPLLIGTYNLEVLHKFTTPSGIVDTTIPPYYFTGQILDDFGPVIREVISYNRTTYNHMDTSFSESSGSFFLDSTTSGTCFLVCLDDSGGISYNHLIAALVMPAVFDDYGFSELNPGKSAKDIKDYNPAATFNGVYWIQPDSYTNPIQVYCDMTTQGGGWTMCARWDRDFSGDWEVCLPINAMRENINIADMLLINTEGNSQASTIDIRSIISEGASMFMHTSMGIDDGTWKYLYFSDIYEVVRANPENIFNTSFDTNDPESVVGVLVNKSYQEGTIWYEYDMSTLTSYSLSNNYYNYCLSGGEGDGHWSIGSTLGAFYTSHPSSSTSTNNDYVSWAFHGKNGSVPAYTNTYPPRVGTARGTASSAMPSCRFNFMFIR